MGVIYKITNPKGKIYVGQTIDFAKRVKRYRWLTAKKQRMLHFSFLKYGVDAHKFEIIEDNILPENLNEREIFWIKELNSFYKENREFGMNLNRGGNTPIWDRIRIDEFSEKFKGENNPFFGKTHSEKAKKIFSDNAKKQMKTQKPTLLAIERGAKAKRKGIIVYNEDGSVHQEFISLTECANHFKVDITTVYGAIKGYRLKGKYRCEYK